MNSKSNLSQSIWVGIGSFSSFLMTIVSAIVLARFLSKSDYGTYRQVLYVYNTLLVIFAAGIPKAYTYFMPRFNLERQKDIVNKVTIILIILGLFFSISLFFSAGFISEILKNPKLEYSLKIFSPIPVMLMPTLGIEGVFATLKKTKYIALYQIISRIIQVLSITIPVIYFEGSYIEAIYGSVISSTFLFFIALYLKSLPFKNYITIDSGITYKTIFKYCTPIMIASLFGIGTQAADQFYISRYYGVEIFAIYANGKLPLPFVTMVTGAVAIVLAPQFSKLYFEGSEGIKSIKNLWNNSIKKSITIIYPLVMFFIFFSKEVFDTLYGQKYIESSNYFIIFSVASFFSVIVFAPLILAMGLTKFYTRLHFIEFILIWILGYLMIIYIKSPYAIIVLITISTIIKILVSLKYVSKKLNIPFFDMMPIKKQLKHIFHSGLILILLKSLIYQFDYIKSSFLICVIGFAFYSATLLVTSNWFKIDYLQSIRPVFNSVPLFKKLQ